MRTTQPKVFTLVELHQKLEGYSARTEYLSARMEITRNQLDDKTISKEEEHDLCDSLDYLKRMFRQTQKEATSCIGEIAKLTETAQ